ncbi:MAG: NAD-dependent protein deacylase [Desulfobulbaceae bacterium]|nr:NAD-dependent protein deacylase [Desulfobulbaceae bacterium]MDY0349756.1 NAD-dependent protein deacylase [Desulfobulbaceae bacterium]
MKVSCPGVSPEISDGAARAAELIRSAGTVIALTGAGASTESGIPDFRGRNGLWSRFDPLEYGTIGAFRRDPVKVWKMFAELLAVTDAEPNAGHHALAAMEAMGCLYGIITQNIDGLHQKAGSRSVVEFHGSLATFSCGRCRTALLLAEVRTRPLPPLCSCGAVLKPDVVFFDEAIPTDALHQTEKLIATADVLIVAGTSCQVAPASTIPLRVRRRGGRIIEVNLAPALGPLADITLAGGFGATMSCLLARLREK